MGLLVVAEGQHLEAGHHPRPGRVQAAGHQRRGAFFQRRPGGADAAGAGLHVTRVEGLPAPRPARGRPAQDYGGHQSVRRLGLRRTLDHEGPGQQAAGLFRGAGRRASQEKPDIAAAAGQGRLLPRRGRGGLPR